MIRLVNVNKLNYKHIKDGDKSEVVVLAKEIDEAPTVEAIPIEWLCNYALSANNASIFFPMFLKWYKEKDSETDTNDAIDDKDGEAIPIEWLKRYEITKGQEVRLQDAINEWEKENDR